MAGENEDPDSLFDDPEKLSQQAGADEAKALEAPGIGHNGGPSVGGIAADRLKSYVERIERVEEEKKALSEDIRDIYTEVKAAGFDAKIVRQVIKLRKMDAQDREKQAELVDLYGKALGLWR